MGFSLSAVIELLSGVVQGSGIGPVLFLSYINEMAEMLERAGVTVKLFADDVKLYMEIVNDCDASKQQNALDSLTEWAICGSCQYQWIDAVYKVLADCQSQHRQTFTLMVISCHSSHSVVI